MASKLGFFLRNPANIYRWLVANGKCEFLSDEQILKSLWRIKFSSQLDFENPKSFNQKLQWLKLHDRNPLYNKLVDKADVKEWVGETIGFEYVIPTYGVWDTFDDIDFSELPSQFVMKCTHSSGGVFLCRDKATIDKKAWKKRLNHQLSRNLYYAGREWPYKDLKPRIIAEEYIGSNKELQINDYKLMCFNGEVKCTFVCSERNTPDGLKVTFFDNEWKVMPFERHFHKSQKEISCPKHFDKMIEIAEKLSKGIPFVRVDLYEEDDRIFFGEMTFYPGNGFEEFTPEEWDYRLGEWIDLSDVYDRKETK